MEPLFNLDLIAESVEEFPIIMMERDVMDGSLKDLKAQRRS